MLSGKRFLAQVEVALARTHAGRHRSGIPSLVLIIDAYNVLHAAPRVDPGFAGLNLPSLVRLVLASRFQSGAVLVCDGTGSRTGLDESYAHTDSPVRVVFTGPGKDADSAIARLVIEEERTGRAGTVTVVSSDKGVLASAIGPFGPKARRMTSEQFMRTVLDDASRSSSFGSGVAERMRPTLDAESAARWMREFGVDPRTPEASRNIEPSAPPKSTKPESTNRDTPDSKESAQDWPEGIDPDDLDMRKWLKE